MRLVYRLQGLYREIVCSLKPFLRATMREASLVRFQLRRWRGRREDVRVVCLPPVDPVHRLPHPAIAFQVVGAAVGAEAAAAGGAERGLTAALGVQTENSVTEERDGAYFFACEGECGGLPATHLESMLLVAAALDLDLVLAGVAPPTPERFGPSGPVFAHAGSETAAKLVRVPGRGHSERPVVGRIVPHVGDPRVACWEADDRGLQETKGPQRPTGRARLPALGRREKGTAPTRWGARSAAGAREDADEGRDAAWPISPGLPTAGPWIFSFGVRPQGVIRLPVFDVQAALGDLPTVTGGGTPSVLFLLPYLAVGGAEKLLFDLIRGLDGLRSLIVTLEPHQRALGQTVDRARELTSHVYTLGDWLPREAHGGAIRHLLRRYRVETLMSWNGTTWFYDEAAALRRAFPHLRLVNQLYNHRGGWIEHYRPSLVRAVDCHVAVNRRIAQALEARDVPTERIRLVYHGVEVPDLPSREEWGQRRDERRRELGLPLNALVVGTFVRIHRQKRPLDVVRLAHRFRDRGVVFLLAGSGPLDSALDRELAVDPPPNLVRLPMCRDPERLFDALDLCLLTSSYEGLPVFLLEGLARGIPCVATAVGDVAVLLAEGGGETVARPGDLDRFEAAIESMRNEDRRRREGLVGRRVVQERFDLDGYREAYASAGVLDVRGRRTEREAE